VSNTQHAESTDRRRAGVPIGCRGVDGYLDVGTHQKFSGRFGRVASDGRGTRPWVLASVDPAESPWADGAVATHAHRPVHDGRASGAAQRPRRRS
jgi:hypothetical protein